MDCSMPGFPILHYLLELAQTRVHWVGDAISTYHPVAPFSFSFSLSQHQGLFQRVIRWLKYWSFGFSICPPNEYSRLISFRMDWFDLLAVQGTLKIMFFSTIWNPQFFSAQSSLWSSSHIYTWLLEKLWLWLYRLLSAKWCLCFWTHYLGLS